MEKVTVPKLIKMKREGKKITMITAYDYPTTMIADAAGVDIILVGGLCGDGYAWVPKHSTGHNGRDDSPLQDCSQRSQAIFNCWRHAFHVL